MPGGAAKSFFAYTTIIPGGLQYVRNMTENKEGGAEIGISLVVAEYEKWEERGKKLAIDQALHPAVLNSILWEKDVTPRKIAEFALQTARKETLWWVRERKELYLLEKSEKYDKARQVRVQIRRIQRIERRNNSPLV